MKHLFPNGHPNLDVMKTSLEILKEDLNAER